MDMNLRRLSGEIVAGLCLMLTAPLCAIAQSDAPAQPPAADQTAAANQNYMLGPQDVIDIQAVGRQDFTTRVKIASDGTIQVPYLNSVQAANKTTEELSADLTKALEAGGFFSNPIIRVEIVGYASRYVTVLGDVTTPGLVPIDRAYHVSEILARAGGLREGAADYVVLRSADGQERQLSISALATGGAADDPLVQAGDKLFSPVAQNFYISGQIKSPGAYPLASGMTVRMAIARGGGLTDLGTDRAVQVTRGGKKLDRVDLESPVEAGDVIVVRERLF
jgi:polysaccharide biosynthesis/export protein